MKTTASANRFPVGLSDTDGLELSFQDLFQTNYFKRLSIPE